MDKAFKVGQIVEGKVKNIKPYGAFIEIAGGKKFNMFR